CPSPRLNLPPHCAGVVRCFGVAPDAPVLFRLCLIAAVCCQRTSFVCRPDNRGGTVPRHVLIPLPPWVSSTVSHKLLHRARSSRLSFSKLILDHDFKQSLSSVPKLLLREALEAVFKPVTRATLPNMCSTQLEHHQASCRSLDCSDNTFSSSATRSSKRCALASSLSLLSSIGDREFSDARARSSAAFSACLSAKTSLSFLSSLHPLSWPTAVDPIPPAVSAIMVAPSVVGTRSLGSEDRPGVWPGADVAGDGDPTSLVARGVSRETLVS
ncbi:unnamed protein product, partial [Ectocarpus sp. 12 AP-2014]